MGMIAELSSREYEETFRRSRIDIQDRSANERDLPRVKNTAYHQAIERLVRFVVPPGARVLVIGCGTGELLAALQPAHGIGVDFDARLVARARTRHPTLRFAVAEAGSLDAPVLAGCTFDYIVMSDVIGGLYDVWHALRQVRRLCQPATRVVIIHHNFLWDPVLGHGPGSRLEMPVEPPNRLGIHDLANLLDLNHFEIVRRGSAQLVPVDVPWLAPLANRYMAQLPVVRHAALTRYLVCKPARAGGPIHTRDYTCSVVVPCKNERGNIDDIVRRTPEVGKATELIFVDGNSTDGTVEAIERHLRAGTRERMRLVHQGDGRGKGDAVRKGFAQATGDVLLILDADLTVPPEDLPKFYAALAEGSAEFVNGSRLVYPMDDEAMRLLNAIGNRLFGFALSAIMGQPLKDTLCGTKALFRRDYERIAAARGFFGELDPFGDFDLLLGAAKQNLKIVELPVRYHARTYGDTKISRFRDGAQLARMTLRAFQRFTSQY
jgi:SAM-dependent methyltransferase